MSSGSNGVDPVRSLRKISMQLRLANLCVNWHQFGQFCINFHAVRKMGFGSSFIGELCSVEERERERESRHRAGLRSAGSAGRPFGVRGGRSGPAARCGRMERGQRRRRGRWERQQGDTWARGGRRRPAAAREAAGGGGSRARGRERGGRGPKEEDEDRFAKSQKCRDPTVMLW
jgi:hypothetical protein